MIRHTQHAVVYLTANNICFSIQLLDVLKDKALSYLTSIKPRFPDQNQHCSGLSQYFLTSTPLLCRSVPNTFFFSTEDVKL